MAEMDAQSVAAAAGKMSSGKMSSGQTSSGEAFSDQASSDQASSDKASPGFRLGGRLALTVVLGALALALSALIALGFGGPLKHDLDALSAVRPQASVVALALAAALAALKARGLASLTALIALAGLIHLGPAWRAPAAAAPGCLVTPLRVAIANIQAVGGSDAHFAAVEAELRAIDADVVALVEASPRFYNRAAGLRADLPYSVGRKGAWGAVILANRPITEITARPWPEDAPIHETATLDLGHSVIGLAAIHLSRPIIAPQERELTKLGEALDGLPARRVLLGDFNAAPWSHAVAEVERIAGVAMAPGYRRTWRGDYPNPFFDIRLPAPYGAQIDHVMASSDIGVRAVRVFDAPGSVHWGVVADLEIPEGPFSVADCGV